MQDVLPACGNGYLDPGEQCDDPGPACSPNCTYPVASPSAQTHTTFPSQATPPPPVTMSSAPPQMLWSLTTISAGSPESLERATQSLSKPFPALPTTLNPHPADGLGATQHTLLQSATTSAADSSDGVDPTVGAGMGGCQWVHWVGKLDGGEKNLKIRERVCLHTAINTCKGVTRRGFNFRSSSER
jgi:hypothetical protein